MDHYRVLRDMLLAPGLELESILHHEWRQSLMRDFPALHFV
jgi:hypothetical protein